MKTVASSVINGTMNCYYLLSSQHVWGTMLSALYGLYHLIQQPYDIDTMTIFIFTDEKIKFNYFAQDIINCEW